jgi:Oxidoreductase molybdopterin binding domain
VAGHVQYRAVSRPGWLVSVLVGGLATAVALLLQALIRDVWQIRTVPERVMEWLLLFVPLSLFERGLLRDVLDLAGGLKPGVVSLAFVSIDEFSAGLPSEIAMDKEALIVYEMNGEPLPREHGYPARLLVPGRYGMKNPKWLAMIRALPQHYPGWYEQRNWNRDGIVKTMARIDVPGDGAQLAPGPQRIAGIAYAGTRGIMLVEYSVDGGRTWTEAAQLEPPPGNDAMVRWEGGFTLEEGEAVTLLVRATDGDGDVQAAQFTLPQPDGATGRHAIQVSAA